MACRSRSRCFTLGRACAQTHQASQGSQTAATGHCARACCCQLLRAEPEAAWTEGSAERHQTYVVFSCVWWLHGFPCVSIVWLAWSHRCGLDSTVLTYVWPNIAFPDVLCILLKPLRRNTSKGSRKPGCLALGTTCAERVSEPADTQGKPRRHWRKARKQQKSQNAAYVKPCLQNPLQARLAQHNVIDSKMRCLANVACAQPEQTGKPRNEAAGSMRRQAQ